MILESKLIATAGAIIAASIILCVTCVTIIDMIVKDDYDPFFKAEEKKRKKVNWQFEGF